MRFWSVSAVIFVSTLITCAAGIASTHKRPSVASQSSTRKNEPVATQTRSDTPRGMADLLIGHRFYGARIDGPYAFEFTAVDQQSFRSSGFNESFVFSTFASSAGPATGTVPAVSYPGTFSAYPDRIEVLYPEPDYTMQETWQFDDAGTLVQTVTVPRHSGYEGSVDEGSVEVYRYFPFAKGDHNPDLLAEVKRVIEKRQQWDREIADREARHRQEDEDYEAQVDANNQMMANTMTAMAGQHGYSEPASSNIPPAQAVANNYASPATPQTTSFAGLPASGGNATQRNFYQANCSNRALPASSQQAQNCQFILNKIDNAITPLASQQPQSHAAIPVEANAGASNPSYGGGEANTCVRLEGRELRNACPQTIELTWCIDSSDGSATCNRGFNNEQTLGPNRSYPYAAGMWPPGTTFRVRYGACFGANSIDLSNSVGEKLRCK